MTPAEHRRRTRPYARLALLALAAAAVLLAATRMSRHLFERPHTLSESAVVVASHGQALPRADPGEADAATDSGWRCRAARSSDPRT